MVGPGTRDSGRRSRQLPFEWKTIACCCERSFVDCRRWTWPQPSPRRPSPASTPSPSLTRWCPCSRTAHWCVVGRLRAVGSLPRRWPSPWPPRPSQLGRGWPSSTCRGSASRRRPSWASRSSGWCGSTPDRTHRARRGPIWWGPCWTGSRSSSPGSPGGCRPPWPAGCRLGCRPGRGCCSGRAGRCRTARRVAGVRRPHGGGHGTGVGRRRAGLGAAAPAAGHGGVVRPARAPGPAGRRVAPGPRRWGDGGGR